jgi:thioredoxin-dependent peroxiredoxin
VPQPRHTVGHIGEDAFDAGTRNPGVSPDSASSHQAFREKFNLPFPLLVDEGHAVAAAYGVWGEQRNIRSHFVIDEHGKAVDVQVQVTPEGVERALQAVGG